MTPRTRIFIAVLLLYIAGVALTLHQALTSIDPRYRESAEASLVETTQVMASLIELDMADQGENAEGGRNTTPINTTRLTQLFTTIAQREITATIFSVTKTQVDLVCYVTDAQGRVIFDSDQQHVGQDFSQWRDVARALRGDYGARTSLADPANPHSAVMYVATALHAGNKLVGVVSVGKPTHSLEQFIASARHKTLTAGLLVAVASLVLAVLLSLWLVRPFGLVGDMWRHVQHARQREAFSWLRLGHRTLLGLRESLQGMQEALSGHNAMAEHVQTLTHELKSPLSAIHAAAELLQSPMPTEQHQRFVGHIVQASTRIQETVDRMLELTTLKARHTLDDARPVALNELLRQVVDAVLAQAASTGLTVTLNMPQTSITVLGDSYWLRRAMSNLIANALDFSPAAGHVTVSLEVDASRRRPQANITVRDQGPGVPAYAKARVFEQFYSLPRPGTGRKSTGLGLALVKQVAVLHLGTASLENGPEGGAVARLSLPLQTAPPKTTPAASPNPGGQAPSV